MIVGLHHAQVSIPVGAEAQARAFYCGVLGLSEIAKPEALANRGGIWLTVGDRQVHLGVEDGVDRNKTRAHLAYAVRDLSAWRGKLKAAGVEILDCIPIPGYERFEFRDPFGNRIEMIEQCN
jgi:catechol 2,3-dioxygenase-like lactoylglutathione lyase family enzyme